MNATPWPSSTVRLIASSTFVNMLGTNLFLVALSVQFFAQHSSNLAAAAVYVAQFLPVIFLMPLAWRICDRLPIRSALIFLELASSAVTLLVGLAVLAGNFPLALALLCVRGFCEMTTKSARNVAVRSITDETTLSRANTWVMAGNFAGQTLGAVLGFALITGTSTAIVIAVSVAAFLASAAIWLAFPPSPPASQAGPARDGASLWRAGAAILARDPQILRATIYLIATMVLLQSLNQVVRVGLPLDWLGLPARAGALNEAIGCVGIVTGLLLVGRFFPDAGTKAVPIGFYFCAAVVASALPFLLPREPALAFALYFAFMVLFEMSFMLGMNSALARCRPEESPALMVLVYGTAFGGMTLMTIVMGAAADQLGFLPLALAVLVVGLGFALALEFRVLSTSVAPGGPRLAAAIRSLGWRLTPARASDE